MSVPETTPNYPVPRADPGEADARFSWGLVYDLGELLADHGYPRLEGLDYPRFMGALFEAIYGRPDSVDLASAMIATSAPDPVERVGDAALDLRPVGELSPLRIPSVHEDVRPLGDIS